MSRPSIRGAKTGEHPKPADVDAARLSDADRDSGNWMTYGRTYTEQRFSPLKQIDQSNAGQLGFAWHFDLDTHRGPGSDADRRRWRDVLHQRVEQSVRAERRDRRAEVVLRSESPA